jgi:hypothetical protein
MLATAIGASAAVVVGGSAILVGVVLLAMLVPRFVRYRRGTRPEAGLVSEVRGMS